VGLALVLATSGCEAFLGRPVTPKQVKEGTCALLEAARIACALAELAGKPCPVDPPGCTALELAEETRARRERDGGEVLAGSEEPCRSAASASAYAPAPARTLEPPPAPSSSAKPAGAKP
jgi:hypothetical protein